MPCEDMKTPTRGEVGHVKVEAEIGVQLSQAKEHLALLKLEEGRKAPPLEPLQGVWPHLDFCTSSFQNP